MHDGDNTTARTTARSRPAYDCRSILPDLVAAS